MRSSKIILCLALCAVSALSQRSEAQSPPSEKSASVSGIVVSALTGAPVSRAHLMLGLDAEEDKTYGAMAGSDGKFSITGMTPGSYAVTLDRIGFSMPTGSDAPQDLLLKPGEHKDDVLLRLVPTGAITGQVTNADGEPVQGVQVQAWGLPGVEGSDVDGTTDSRGHFRIGGLAPGRYRILATPENHYAPPEQRTDGTVDSQDAPTYYPGVLTFRQGTRVVVTAGGETSGVEIHLAKVPIVAVSGKVEGAPPGAFNPQLFVAQKNGISRSTAGIKPDGTFRLWRLNPGQYEISGMWQAPGGRFFATAAVPFEVAGANNIENLFLRLMPPADIAGHIEFHDDASKPAVKLHPKLTLAGTGVRANSRSADIDPDGSFRIPQMPAGKYRVVLSWNKAYVTSIQFGSNEIDGSLLDLTNGVSGDLAVRVASATGAISGNVTDNKGPAPGSRVALVFDGEGGGIRPRVETVGAGGAYLFEGVAPAGYKLIAVSDADGEYIAQGGRLDDYEDLMESIEIHSGEKLTRDLKLRLPDDK